MSVKGKEINHGTVEIDSAEFDPRHVKIRITTMIDEDVIIGLKKLASRSGQKYQTIINSVLRRFVEGDAGKKAGLRADEKRIRQIVRDELRRRA